MGWRALLIGEQIRLPKRTETPIGKSNIGEQVAQVV